MAQFINEIRTGKRHINKKIVKTFKSIKNILIGIGCLIGVDYFVYLVAGASPLVIAMILLGY